MSTNRVVILGVGMHKFGRFPKKSVSDMGREAALMALKDAGVDYRDVNAGFCAHVHQPMMTGINVFGELGMTGLPITNVEAACASSTRALMLAADEIAAGNYDICLVIGVEKMQKGLVGLGVAGMEKSYNELMGLDVLPGRVAMMATRHMYHYGTKPEHFAYASVKAHRNGVLNPYAQHQVELSLEEVLNSRMIAYPITLYQCCPTSDSAAAVVLASKRRQSNILQNLSLSAPGREGVPFT